MMKMRGQHREARKPEGKIPDGGETKRTYTDARHVIHVTVSYFTCITWIVILSPSLLNCPLLPSQELLATGSLVPERAEDFDRLLLAQPSSSPVWIRWVTGTPVVRMDRILCPHSLVVN